MSRVDRAVRRARQHLQPDEALLVSAWGIEADGRRHRVVVVTDQRVLVAWRRPGPPDVLSMNASATYDRLEGRLTLTDGESSITLRDVETREGRQVVQLLDRRHARPLSERLGEPFHVRVIPG